MRIDFFPLFRGSPPLFGHLSPAFLVIFRLDLTRALGLCFFVDGLLWWPLRLLLLLLLLLSLTPFLCFQVAGGKT